MKPLHQAQRHCVPMNTLNSRKCRTEEKKGTRNFQHHFSISITAYEITDNKELKYHHVFISYGGFSAHCSVRFSVILCIFLSIATQHTIHSLWLTTFHCFSLFAIILRPNPDRWRRLTIRLSGAHDVQCWEEDDGCVKFIFIFDIMIM